MNPISHPHRRKAIPGLLFLACFGQNNKLQTVKYQKNPIILELMQYFKRQRIAIF
jgi:hypothetical protein